MVSGDTQKLKQPFFKFFPSDWRSDPALRSCSLAARGLWMEMICLMHEADPRGYLMLNGRPASVRQLANLCGAPLKETSELVTELEEAGVFSRDEDGNIFSRRMRREADKAQTNSENGKQGGRPKQSEAKATAKANEKRNESEPKANSKPNHKANEKPYILEARVQNLDTEQLSKIPEPSARPPGRTSAELDAIEAALREAAGVVDSPNAPGAFSDFSEILGFIDAGVSLEETILPVLRAKRAKGHGAFSWRFFTPAIRQAAEKRQAAQGFLPSRTVQGAPPGKAYAIGYHDIEWTEDFLRERVAGWRERGTWFAENWGPPPDQNGRIKALCAELSIPLDRHSEPAQ
jgi:uncharacterized protein YdaU (DUF1376 family)